MEQERDEQKEGRVQMQEQNQMGQVQVEQVQVEQVQVEQVQAELGQEQALQAGRNLSRRAVLSTIGVAGIALAAGSVWGGAGLLPSAVTNDVYGGCTETGGGILPHVLVATVAQLRSMEQSCTGVSYLVSDPGREGLFVYDAADGTTADNEGTVLVSSAGLRFKRIYEDALCVTWFGAIGDGDHHDTPSMQLAIDTAASLGCDVYVPAGSYRVLELVVPSHVRLYGVGGSVLQGIRPGGTVVAVAEQAEHVAIEDVIVDGLSTAKTGISIRTGASSVTMRNVEIRHLHGDQTRGGYGMMIASGCHHIRVDHCKIHTITGYEDGVVGNGIGANRGMLIRDVRHTLIHDCVFADIDGFEDGDMIQVQTVLLSSGSWSVSDVTIRDCTFLDFKKRAVKLQASGVSVLDNRISSAHAGEGNECTHAAITSLSGDDNVITGNRITLARSIHGIELYGGYNTIVANNIISVDETKQYTQARGSMQTALSMYQGTKQALVMGNTFSCGYREMSIAANCSHIRVQSNLFRNSGTYALVLNGCTGILVEGNSFEGGTDDMHPYQCITLTNCGHVLASGNVFQRAYMAFRASGTLGKLRIYSNQFETIVTPVRSNELQAGHEANLFVGEGQL